MLPIPRASARELASRRARELTPRALGKMCSKVELADAGLSSLVAGSHELGIFKARPFVARLWAGPLRRRRDRANDGKANE